MPLLRRLLIPFSILYYLFQLIRNKLFDLNILKTTKFNFPGGVDQDLYRLGYKKIKRPMFPLDKDMEDPDLNAVLIPVLK